MRPKIWISCALAILVVITWAVWKHRGNPAGSRQAESDETRFSANAKNAKLENSRTGVAPVSAPPRRSDIPVATGTGRISGEPEGGTANMRKQDARAPINGRDARSTSQPAIEPMTADLPDPVATATIRVGDQTFLERSNEYGVFNVIRIQQRQQVALEVAFGAGDPGQRVVAMVEDGGTLRDGQRVLPMQLDAQHKIAFSFTADDVRGVYRIRLRRGTETKMVQFWAGEPLALASR